MKTIIQIFSLFLLIFFPLTAQEKAGRGNPEPRQDTISTIPPKKNVPEIHDFNRKPDIYSDRKDNPGPRGFHNLPYPPKRKSAQDSIAERRFPGSSRYYGKSLSPYAYDNGYGRYFIVEPDKSSKQYLIIKDPLTGKVTR